MGWEGGIGDIWLNTLLRICPYYSLISQENLVNALDMIGYRTQYRGLFNDEHIMTEGESPLLADVLGEFKPSPKPSKGG